MYAGSFEVDSSVHPVWFPASQLVPLTALGIIRQEQRNKAESIETGCDDEAGQSLKPVNARG